MSEAEAHLDPWCLVQLESGEAVLFGYALRHPATGGLGWLASTEVLELDTASGKARTRSGRHYELGRRFEAIDVGGEGAEARMAFDYLVGREFDGMDDLFEIDRTWVAAQKMARHLAIAPPSRRSDDLRHFVRANIVAYLALRRSRGTM
jgi:hypothetical protein